MLLDFFINFSNMIYCSSNKNTGKIVTISIGRISLTFTVICPFKF